MKKKIENYKKKEEEILQYLPGREYQRPRDTLEYSRNWVSVQPSSG